LSDTETSRVPVRWVGGLQDGYLEMIDQSRSIEDERAWLVMAAPEDVVEHVADGAIRNAPDLGTAAAYAVAMIGRDSVRGGEPGQLPVRLEALADRLEEIRPEIVDLRWALDRMREVVDASDEYPPRRFVERLFEEAHTISTEVHADE